MRSNINDSAFLDNIQEIANPSIYPSDLAKFYLFWLLLLVYSVASFFMQHLA